MKKNAEDLQKARINIVKRDFGKDEEKTGSNAYTKNMKKSVYLGSTDVNSLGDRIGRMKNKLLKGS